MKLKLDADGHVVVQDGKPVYVTDDGKEIAFDAAGTAATIGRLNGEAKGHRERAEAAEGKLKAFDGIADPAAALAALGTVKNLDDKKLIDAGEVERIKAEAIKAVEDKYAPIVKRSERLESELVGERIGGSFARSKFIGEKLAIPADLVEARFGKNFKLEDGKVVAYDNSGNRLYSPANPGNLAEFEEALELLVDQYPSKAHILKGTGASGGGASQSQASSGKRSLSRQQFAAMSPQDQAKTATDPNVAIVD